MQAAICPQAGQPTSSQRATADRYALQHRVYPQFCQQQRVARSVDTTSSRLAHSCRGATRQSVCASTVAAAVPAVGSEDKWIARTLSALLPTEAPALAAVQDLQTECLGALRTQRMPTQRQEEFRFTDLSSLLKADLQAPAQSSSVTEGEVSAHPLTEADGRRLVVVDGVVALHLSDLSGMPEGCYVGCLAGAPADIASQYLGSQSRSLGGPFATLNGAALRDVIAVVIPPDITVSQPLHILYVASGNGGGAPSANSPRLLVVVQQNASLELIEEFSGIPEAHGQYLTNAVAELDLAQNAQLTHGYVNLENSDAWHVKATLVKQAEQSRYTLTEASLGGALARHDVGAVQHGPDTETTMRSFLLAGDRSTRDLHTKLRLDHPRGVAAQLHKCIVSAATGRGVFDGNVRVGQLAQQTNAGQLSRNLLLVPKATVNVKPNLQIIADDVKCTHGCTVSDLEEEQLFYFRARGIDDETARQMLVFSFGAEVTQYLRHKQLIQRIQQRVDGELSKAVAVQA